MTLHYTTIISLLMLTSGCVYLDYGVRRNDPQLLPTPNVLGHEFGGYQFWSRISNDPNIEITHARYPTSNPSVIESALNIRDYKSTDISIQSVTVEHRDRKNNLIKPTGVKWAKLPAEAGSPGLWFKKTYDKSAFPRTVIEIIRIEILRGTETEVLEYRFILKKKMSGTFWDAVMSV